MVDAEAAPTVALTGASGFVGGNLAALLLADGVTVRGTRRASSPADHIADLQIQWMQAELADVDALARAFEGAEAVFHCAAAVTQTRFAAGAHADANVHGTRNVVTAAQKAGVRRLIHCSSAVTCAVAAPGGPDVTEEDPWNFAEHGLDDAYSRTKRDAELAALSANGSGGLEVVVANPAFMFGPRDVKPSSGKLIVEIVAGHVVGIPSGTNSFVDVRDVARGMIAAWHRGRPGERYLLGGENLPYSRMFEIISQELGRKPPRLRLPDAGVRFVGVLGDLAERIVGHEIVYNSAVAAFAVQKGHRFSSAKAARELGYTLTPIRVAVHDAISWFRAHGMLAAAP